MVPGVAENGVHQPNSVNAAEFQTFQATFCGVDPISLHPAPSPIEGSQSTVAWSMFVANAVTIDTLAGPFELRAGVPGERSAVSLPMRARDVEYSLRAALPKQRLAMIDLVQKWGTLRPEWLTDREQLIQALMRGLDGGRLVVTALSDGGASSDGGNDRAWAAYSAFQARVGREFQVAMRSHRLVPRERVASAREQTDLDVVPATEAVNVIVSVAKTKSGGNLDATLTTLLENVVDMRSPPNADGFVLLRAPISHAARYVAPEDVITPSKLKKLKQTEWIEIHVVDEDGNPWSGSYELMPPQDDKQRGTMDELGIIRVDNILGGACEFDLPDLSTDSFGPGSVKKKA